MTEAIKLAKGFPVKLGNKDSFRSWIETAQLLVQCQDEPDWFLALRKPPYRTEKLDANGAPELDSDGAVIMEPYVISPKIEKTVRATLLLAIESKAKDDLSNYLKAHEVWAKVRKFFGEKSRMELSMHLSEFWGKRFDQTDDVVGFIRRKVHLAQICIDADRTISEGEIVMTVLANTRAMFESVIENVAELDVLDLETVTCRLRDAQESRLLLQNSPSFKLPNSVVAAAATTNNRPKCSHCGRRGHLVNSCFNVVPCRRCGKLHNYGPDRCLQRSMQPPSSSEHL